MLKDTVYTGEYFFNKKSAKNGPKPPSEWIKLEVPTIISKTDFERVAKLREQRSPKKTAPRVVNSPTLLTGILRCGVCGSAMTIATGKGGRYRYYKCTSRINKGNKTCSSKNIPMGKFDEQILEVLADRILTPERVKIMLKEMKNRLENSRAKNAQKGTNLDKEIAEANLAIDRLYEAVEKGFLPMDATLEERARKHQTKKQELLLEKAKLNRTAEMPKQMFRSKNIEVFCKAIKSKLLDN